MTAKLIITFEHEGDDEACLERAEQIAKQADDALRDAGGSGFDLNRMEVQVLEDGEWVPL